MSAAQFWYWGQFSPTIHFAQIMKVENFILHGFQFLLFGLVKQFLLQNVVLPNVLDCAYWFSIFGVELNLL